MLSLNWPCFLKITMKAIERYVDLHKEDLISDLQTLIRQPSVSARGEGLVECANLVSDIMRKAGIYSEVLYPRFRREDVKGKSKQGEIAPMVYGEVKSKSNPKGKTILFYNHYDVQP